jgi:hypothetical protein
MKLKKQQMTASHSKPFTEMFNKTFENLLKIEPGKSGNIANSEMAKAYGIEIALDTCKMFIDENPDFQLSNDYKFIQRINKF